MHFFSEAKLPCAFHVDPFPEFQDCVFCWYPGLPVSSACGDEASSALLFTLASAVRTALPMGLGHGGWFASLPDLCCCLRSLCSYRVPVSSRLSSSVLSLRHSL